MAEYKASDKEEGRKDPLDIPQCSRNDLIELANILGSLSDGTLQKMQKMSKEREAAE